MTESCVLPSPMQCRAWEELLCIRHEGMTFRSLESGDPTPGFLRLQILVERMSFRVG